MFRLSLIVFSVIVIAYFGIVALVSRSTAINLSKRYRNCWNVTMERPCVSARSRSAEW